jgi:quercetin dioxygenase-like cupin family protein
MSRPRSLGLAVASSAILAGLLTGALAQAPGTGLAPVVPQTPGFKSQPILVGPITGIEDRELVLISVSLEPGASSPVHWHPGDCYATVIEGTVDVRVEGKETRRLSAGDVQATPAKPLHQFRNVGDKPARLLTTLVVEKGKPRTVAVPKPEGW